MLTLELDASLQSLLGCGLICLRLRALRLIARRGRIEQLMFRSNGPRRRIATEYYRGTSRLGGNFGGGNRRGNFDTCGRGIRSICSIRSTGSLAKTRAARAE
jgi:hypothetical protein